MKSTLLQWPSVGQTLTFEFGYGAELQSGHDPVRTTSTQMSFPETVLKVVQKLFCCANQQFHQLSGWLVSDDPAGEEAGCGGPGLAWFHMVYGC